MKRTTIMLPHDLKEQALSKANKLGKSLGQLIRESLAQSLEAMQDNHVGDDLLFSDEAVYHGDSPIDLARHHDEYLYEVKK